MPEECTTDTGKSGIIDDEALKDYTYVAGAYIEAGARSPEALAKVMMEKFPDLTHGDVQRLFAEVKADAEARNGIPQSASKPAAFVTALRGRLGSWDAVSSFINAIHEHSPDLFNKLVNKEELTEDEHNHVVQTVIDHPPTDNAKGRYK